MRSRSGLILLMLCVGLLGIPMSATPASAASMPIRFSTYHAAPGEAVRIYTTAAPTGRVVYLQRYAAGRWSNYKATRSGSSGATAFAVYAASTSVAYRTYAPALRYHGHSYPSLLSRYLKVVPEETSLSLAMDNSTISQPQSEAAFGPGASNYALAEGQFSPAREGHAVAVQAKLDDGAWHTVGTGTQNANGYYRVPVEAPYLGTADSPRTFRAYTTAGRTVISEEKVPTFRSLQFDEEFTNSGSTFDPGTWAPRSQGECDDTQAGLCTRKCASVPSTLDNSLLTVQDGYASLGIKKVAGADAKCPEGHWQNAMIGTGPLDHRYGHGIFAARIKTQSSQGMHGGFWLQGPAVTGSEIDVLEYNGDGRNDGGASSNVHYDAADGQTHSSGGPHSLDGVIGASHTPSQGWHVYSVQWSTSGYVFRVDGIPVLTTDEPFVSNSPEEIVLSMASSDYELDRMVDSSSRMQVDWVRSWAY